MTEIVVEPSVNRLPENFPLERGQDTGMCDAGVLVSDSVCGLTVLVCMIVVPATFRQMNLTDHSILLMRD
jgi:hypothetical protein